MEQTTQTPISLIPGFETSQSIATIGPIFVKLLSDVKNAVRNKKNDHTKGRYADLEAVIDALDESLSDNAIGVTQSPNYADGLVTTTTTLLHSSLEFISQKMPIPITKNDAQSVGSGITYGRRYALKSIFGITDTDDDGEEASKERKPDEIKRKDTQPENKTQPAPQKINSQGSKQADTKTQASMNAPMTPDLELNAQMAEHKDEIMRILEVNSPTLQPILKEVAMGFYGVTDATKMPMAVADRHKVTKTIVRAITDGSKEAVESVINQLKTKPREFGMAARKIVDAESNTTTS